MTELVEIRHFHLFCGAGGGALGFDRGRATHGSLEARFRCIGGVDSDPVAAEAFSRLVGVRATCLDLFDEEQFRDWHVAPPPPAWRAATPADLRRASGGERPHVVFTSPPCKGFSGLISQRKSISRRYRALNALTIRGVMLALEAWAEDPPEFFLLENVPRIQNRGRDLVDAIRALLEDAGYSVAESTHCCGEIGGLAQRRQRFLLVARHRERVPPFLWEPPRRPLRTVGDVIGPFPLPDDPRGGPMHRSRRVQWKTWVRLALIPPGKDWRALRDLAVEDGVLRDYALVPGAWHRGALGVQEWSEPGGTVTGGGRPAQGAFSVADPRYRGKGDYGQLGVREWEEPSGAVSGQSLPGGGRYSIADPRVSAGYSKGGYTNAHHVADWDHPTRTVIGSTRVGSGALSIADPRLGGVRHNNVFRIVRWDGESPAVTAGAGPSSGGLALADPRPGWSARNGTHGVTGWDAPSATVVGAARHDNGPWSVADPRDLPEEREQGVWLIVALDGSWHRPFTTLELAALQGFVTAEEYLELPGISDTAHRGLIGNAVPPPAAEAIASTMARTLLMARAGESWALSATPVWARDLAIALSLEADS